VFGSLAKGSARVPAQVRIADTHVEGATLAPPLLAELDYFVVTVHELFLDYSRKLWQDYVPSVWASGEFLYDGQSRTVPFVLGPDRLGAAAPDVGAGMLFVNTRIVGPVPYKGGPITLSVVLSRVAKDNLADRLLSVVESTASAFSVATALGPYIAVGKAITAGVEGLLGLGSAPLIGVQDTMAFDVMAQARTGYFALMDAVPARPLWVKENALRSGVTLESSTPVRDVTYVLYSIAALQRDPGRNDVLSLPRIGDDWRRIQEFAARPDEMSLTAAKALMLDLSVRLRYHPDLTRTQADRLYVEWAEQIRPAHDAAVDLANRGAGEEQLSDEAAQIRSIAAQVMSL
jgi:hypothetical protein